MPIFDVEFIFCCLCFAEDIEVAINTKYVKNYHFGCFCHRTAANSFRLENFHLTDEQMFTCYYYLCLGIYFDSINWLHYYKKVFFFSGCWHHPFPKRKCYSYYRKAIKRILKYFPRFIVSKWELTFQDLVMMQFSAQRAHQTQQVMNSIPQKKWLSRHQVLE